MNSKYTGEQVETLLDKMSSGGGDPFKIGEIRWSPLAGAPFGEDYILAGGQNISTIEYPNVSDALSFSEFSNARIMSLSNLTELPYTNFQNKIFKISDRLLGRFRFDCVMPEGEPATEEDYINIFKTSHYYLDISEDGNTWQKKYAFPYTSDPYIQICGFFVVNGNVVFICTHCDISATSGITMLDIFTYSSPIDDLENWEEKPLLIPNILDQQDITFKSLIYGNGYYVLLLKSSANSKTYTGIMKSTDLITWERPAFLTEDWNDSGSIDINILFTGGMFIYQAGYVMISNDIDSFDTTKVIGGGLGSDTHRITGVEYVEIAFMGMVQKMFFVAIGNKLYTLGEDSSVSSGWNSEVYSLPAGTSDLTGVGKTNETTNCILVMDCYNNYFAITQTSGDTELKKLSPVNASEWLAYSFFIWNNHIISDGAYADQNPCIADIMVSAPNTLGKIPGIFGYVKVK